MNELAQGRYVTASSRVNELRVFFSDKPSVPQNLRVTAVNKDSISLAWDEPDKDGGAPIKRYVVEKADVKRNVFSEAGDTAADNRQFKVTKLLEGNDYLFHVAAENEIGQGKPASLPEPVTAKLPFGQLRLLTAENHEKYLL